MPSRGFSNVTCWSSLRTAVDRLISTPTSRACSAHYASSGSAHTSSTAWRKPEWLANAKKPLESTTSYWSPAPPHQHMAAAKNGVPWQHEQHAAVKKSPEHPGFTMSICPGSGSLDRCCATQDEALPASHLPGLAHRVARGQCLLKQRWPLSGCCVGYELCCGSANTEPAWFQSAQAEFTASRAAAKTNYCLAQPHSVVTLSKIAGRAVNTVVGLNNRQRASSAL